MGQSIPSSIRGIRVIRGSILLLGFVLCSFQFATSAKAAPTSSIDDIDCITSYDTDDEQSQVCEDPSDPWNDLDEMASVANDKAVIPSRQDQDPPQFTGTGFDAITLRLLGITPVPSPPARPFYCLHKHTPERAPPSLV